VTTHCASFAFCFAEDAKVPLNPNVSAETEKQVLPGTWIAQPVQKSGKEAPSGEADRGVSGGCGWFRRSGGEFFDKLGDSVFCRESGFVERQLPGCQSAYDSSNQIGGRE